MAWKDRTICQGVVVHECQSQKSSLGLSDSKTHIANHCTELLLSEYVLGSFHRKVNLGSSLVRNDEIDKKWGPVSEEGSHYGCEEP